MDIFLLILAVVWLVFASFFDLRKREIPNWLSFSLIVFALVYRAFFSVLNSDLMFFIYGIAGLLIFVGLGYLFYYSRVFAGGDAKLLMALGAILPLSPSIPGNLIIFAAFLFLILLVGSIYGIIWSLILVFRNQQAFLLEFNKQLKKYRGLNYISIILAAIMFLFLVILNEPILFILPLIILAFPILYVYAKSVEESCMILRVNTRELTEGDWLYSSVRIKGRTIKPDWEGLNSKELGLLREYNGRVKIKQGIPFVPVFLIAFLILICLRNSLWGFF